MNREVALTRAALLSVAASLLHAFITGEHFDDWWGYGVFFLVAAMAQAIFGGIPFFSRMLEGTSILDAWPRARLQAYYWAGIVGNALIIGMYVVTRTVGIPYFGPNAGKIEAVGGIDIVSKLVELALILHLLWLLKKLSRAGPAAALDAG